MCFEMIKSVGLHTTSVIIGGGTALATAKVAATLQGVPTN